MIEVKGTFNGSDALLVRIEEIAGTQVFSTFSVHLAHRDAEGDHLYQRTIRVPKGSANLLMVLQVAMDELPGEALLGKPIPDDTPLPPLELL